MQGHRITHIRKTNPALNCACITDVKLGKGDKLSIEEVIKMMQGKGKDRMNHQFYLKAGGREIGVIAVPESDPQYIRTERSDSPYDSLLDLPTF